MGLATVSRLCWCGLPPELHDGRELDREGNLHRFNEERETSPAEWEADYPRPLGQPAPFAPLVQVVQSETEAELRSELKQLLPGVIAHCSAGKAIPRRWSDRLRHINFLVQGSTA